MQSNVAPGEQFIDFSLLDPSDIRVPGIVDMVVVPDDQPIVSDYPKHFCGDLLFRTAVQN
jgi:hypothetical protein